MNICEHMAEPKPRPEPYDWKHVGVSFGFYPFHWTVEVTWGPVLHTINLGPFALTFVF